MLNYLQIKILRKLQEEQDFITSKNLSDFFELSSKTILKHIHSINHVIQRYEVGYIEIVSSLGIKLIILDKTNFELLLNDMTNSNRIPETQEERLRFISKKLILNYSVSSRSLIEELYISESTLTGDLTKLKKRLEKYDLNLITQKNKKYQITGNEENIRKFFADLIDNDRITKIDELTVISDKILIPLLKKHRINISDNLLKNLSIHLFIASLRVKNNCTISNNELLSFEVEMPEEMKTELNYLLRIYLNLEFPNNELEYFYSHIFGKQEFKNPFDIKNEYSEDLSSHYNIQISKMFRRIYKKKGIDFFHDKELRTNLLLHLVPFNSRAKAEHFVKNPLIQMVKKEIPFAYEIAVIGLQALQNEFNAKFTDDEIGLFALHFYLAIERSKKMIKQFNIILVCPAGRTTSELVLQQLNSKFSEFINSITICEYYNLESHLTENSSYDLLVTTFPIEIDKNIPIIQVETFLTEHNINQLKKSFNTLGSFSYDYLLNKELFFTNIQAETKLDILNQLIDLTQTILHIPDNFIDSVLERESFSSTDVGNLIAIPHPNEDLLNQSIVTIGILDKPIFWNTENVQLIFLISISHNDNSNIESFYKWLSTLIGNKEQVKNIIQKKTFESLFEKF